MALCRDPKPIRKKLKVCVLTEAQTFPVGPRKERISQRATLDLVADSFVPEPIVFNPLSPTRLDFQRIRGLRPSEAYSVEINGTTAGVKYSGREFSKNVPLQEGTNIFDVRLAKGPDSGKIVTVHINKDTLPPDTRIIVNNREVASRAITNSSFTFFFERTDDNPPIATFFSLNGGPDQVFSHSMLLDSEGSAAIDYWSVDSLGNEEVPHKSVLLIIDRTPPTSPVIDISALPLKTRLGIIPVHGTASIDTVRVSLGSIDAVLSGTTWSANFPLTIEGVNVITATAYDEAGNASTPASVSIIRDQTPPGIPVLLTTINRINFEPLQIIGSQTSDTFSMLLNGVPGLIKLTSSVRWTFDASLVEGINTFDVRAVDDVGNVSAPIAFSITLDTTPPPPPVVDSFLSPRRIAAILLTGSTSTDTARIVINNNTTTAVINPDHTWYALIQLADEGNNFLDIQAEDDLGNRSLATSIVIILDRIPPHPPTIDPTPFFTKIVSLTLAGNKTTDSVEILINGDSSGVTFPSSTRWTKTVSLVEGFNTFEARAKDFVGNISEPALVTVELKTTIGTFTISSFPGQTFLAKIKISGHREKSSVVLVNGRFFQIDYPDTIDEGILWEANFNLALGTNNFTLQSIDRAGNLSNAQNVTIERIEPITVTGFGIDSLYAFTEQNKNKILINGNKAPVLLAGAIRSIFLSGHKPIDTNVVSNFGSVFLPDGISGKTWSINFLISSLSRDALRITLDEQRLLEPPEITVSRVFVAKNTFSGSIVINIGGTVSVEMEQNAEIVITDFQLRNTPSPILGIPIDSLLRTEINLS